MYTLSLIHVLIDKKYISFAPVVFTDSIMLQIMNVKTF